MELYKKELADHLNSKRFLLIFALLFFVSAVSTINAVSNISETITEETKFVFLKLYSTGSDSLYSFGTFLAYLGPLAGIALGFDAINNERSLGTLNRLSSQPIYRDSIINAKFMAGATVIFCTVMFMGLCVSGYGLIMIGIPPSAEEIVRALVFLLLTVVYISFWLALATAFSVICRHAATSAIAGIAIWLFVTMFFGLITRGIANAMYPVSDNSDTARVVENFTLYLQLSRFSPYFLFTEAATTILDPSIRSIGIVTTEQMSGALSAPLDLMQSMLLIWPHLAVTVALAIVSFAVAYVKFMRQEIRS